MGKETYKKQYIAPVVYLNRFATNEMIGVRLKTDKKNGNKPKLFKANINDVGYIIRFYDIPTCADPKFWEKYYAKKVDPLYANPLKHIISRIMLCPKESYQLEEEEKRLLARIICTQMLRTPKIINKGIENAPAIWGKLKNEILKMTESVWPEDRRIAVQEHQFSPDDYKQMVMESINSEAQINRLEMYMLNRFWLIYYNDMPCSFMTSDCPVVVYNLINNSTSSNDTGLAHMDTAILFPLTPKILIHLVPVPDPIYSALSGDFNGRLHPITEKDLKFVLNANVLQMDNCHKHSFMTIKT